MELTQDEYNKLKEELDYRKDIQREQIKVELIEAAELGDLYRENFPFDAAVARQRVNENRIQDLTKLLQESKVRLTNEISTTVKVGCQIKLLKNNSVEMELKLVTPETYKLNANTGYISTESPLGNKLVDKIIGEEIIIESKIGKVTYKVREIL